MPTVDLVDETFLVVDRAVLAAVVADPVRWQEWWPDLELTVALDRGLAGIRWSASGAWTGSLEIWLEPVADGVVLHHYARLDRVGSTGAVLPPPTDARGRRRADRERAARATAWKRHAWAIKDALEAARPRP